MKKVLLFVLVITVLISCLMFLPLMIGGRLQGEQSANAGVAAATAGNGEKGDILKSSWTGETILANGSGGSIVPAGASGTKAEGLTMVATPAKTSPGELFLHIGSPIALSDGVILPIDSGNPGFTPILYKGRTLIPLRFVSEFFNADVDYNAQTQAGIVEIDGKTAEFPVGRDYYTLDGARIPLDTETLNIDGRIMLPLRALCEQVLGLSVDYSDSVIQIAKTAELDDDTVKSVKSKIGMYVRAADLDTLTEYFSQFEYDRYYYVDYEEADIALEVIAPDMAMRDDAPEPAPSAAASATPSAAPAPVAGLDSSGESVALAMGDPDDYSSTNTQVEGVDEGDIIKTDGKYIYLSCYDSIRIINATGKMSLAAKIEIPNYSLADMYIDAGRLIAVGNEYTTVMRELPDSAGKVNKFEFWTNYVLINVYDTSDMSDIELLRSYKIEGYITTTRKQDGYLYLLSSQYLWNYPGDITDPRPLAGENGALEPLPVSDIMIAPGCPANGFMTLSAINIFDAAENVTGETITVNGYNTTQYMSNKAMYITTQDYIFGSGNDLSIAKFSINGGKIGYAGSGSVRGSTNNQFSMDEYQGYLRVATTEWDGMNKNNLFVLDGNMHICGSVEGFAPEERVYSARFMGSKGYIVTFRQTDPLFVFDLSDPKNPTITGELKVPGFSTYLHPVSENIVLGIGHDVYDIYMKDRYGKEVVVGQNTGGIKLSLFDVSDMGKPREIDTLILGDGGYAEILDNHKAAMFKADDSLLAFCAEIFDNAQGREWWNGAIIISYEDNMLSERGRIESTIYQYSGIYYGYAFSGQRLVYIGNTLYFADNNMIRSFDIDTLAEIQTLRLG